PDAYPFPYPYASRPERFDPGAWTPAAPVPPGYHLEKRPLLPLVYTGVGIFAFAYSTGALSALFQLDNSAGYAFIPVAGPFIAAAASRIPHGVMLDPDLRRIPAYIAGAFQGAGAVMLITGLFVRRDRVFLDPPVTIAPLAAPRFAGAGVSGKF